MVSVFKSEKDGVVWCLQGPYGIGKKSFVDVIKGTFGDYAGDVTVQELSKCLKSLSTGGIKKRVLFCKINDYDTIHQLSKMYYRHVNRAQLPIVVIETEDKYVRSCGNISVIDFDVIMERGVQWIPPEEWRSHVNRWASTHFNMIMQWLKSGEY